MKQAWNKFTISVLLLVIFYIHPFYAEGFSVGILVKVLDGYIKIEDLSIGDLVLCFDDEKKVIESSLINVEKKIIDSYLRVQIADEYLSMALDQKIYNEKEDVWINAKSLQDKDVLCVSSYRN